MANAAEAENPRAFEGQAKQNQASGDAEANTFRARYEGPDASLEQLGADGVKNLEAVVESAAAARKGAEALSQEVLSFTRRSWADQLSAVQSLSRARSIQELVELQTGWIKASAEACVTQLGRNNEIVTTALQEAFEPINARVAATVEGFHSAR